MKNLWLIAVIAMITITSCTKTVNGPTPPAPGPVLTFKSYSIVTIGDSIKNVTAILPFTLPATIYLNYLNPTISVMQCYTEWHTISETGQPVEMGSAAQATSQIASLVQNNDGISNCTMLQYQNKETDHYTDGSSEDLLIGQQYYAIVKVQ
jgi:hypothetical protein